MLLAHRIRLDPNNVQASYLTRAAGTARFAFNWGLAEWERQYQAWKVNSSLARKFHGSRPVRPFPRFEVGW